MSVRSAQECFQAVKKLAADGTKVCAAAHLFHSFVFADLFISFGSMHALVNMQADVLVTGSLHLVGDFLRLTGTAV